MTWRTWLFLFLLLAACARVPYTGRLQLDMAADDEERQAARAQAQAYMEKASLEEDTAAAQRVQRVGGRIARAAALPDQDGRQPEAVFWHFYTVKEGEVNAFCLADGSVFVNTGLVEMAKNDDELACVLGHEAAHVIARHGGERESRETLSATFQEAISVALSFADVGVAGTIFGTAYAPGVKYGVLLPFSRSDEAEADYIGLALATRAGYDPALALDFWRRMAASEGEATTAQWRSTHPATAARVADLEKALPEMERFRRAHDVTKTD